MPAAPASPTLSPAEPLPQPKHRPSSVRTPTQPTPTQAATPRAPHAEEPTLPVATAAVPSPGGGESAAPPQPGPSAASQAPAGAGTGEPAVLSPPEYAAAYLQNPPPAYPRSARRAGDQGTVVLRVLVSIEGVAARVELERSSGSASLDSAALDAVQRWRFVPARRGATPVEAWVKVPVVFRLTPDA